MDELDIVADFLTTFGTPVCECREEAPFRTSWTEVNPGRRFYGYPNYGKPSGRCRFFVWVDPDYPERYKHVINGLLRKNDRLEKENQEILKKIRVLKLGKLFGWGVWGAILLSVGWLVARNLLVVKNQ